MVERTEEGVMGCSCLSTLRATAIGVVVAFSASSRRIGLSHMEGARILLPRSQTATAGGRILCWSDAVLLPIQGNTRR